jgi:hypothetical protein
MPGRPCAPFPVLTGPPCWRNGLWRPVHRFRQGWKGCIRAGSRKQSPVSRRSFGRHCFAGCLGRKPCSRCWNSDGNPQRVRSALRPPTYHTSPLASLGLAKPSRGGPPPAKPGGSPRDRFALAARSRQTAKPGHPNRWLSCRVAFLVGWRRYVQALRARWAQDCVAWVATSCWPRLLAGVRRFSKSCAPRETRLCGRWPVACLPRWDDNG